MQFFLYLNQNETMTVSHQMEMFLLATASNNIHEGATLVAYRIDFQEEFSYFTNGRGGKIRTCDPLVPNQMRYQTALRPETNEMYII